MQGGGKIIKLHAQKGYNLCNLAVTAAERRKDKSARKGLYRNVNTIRKLECARVLDCVYKPWFGC